jgi:hypothetical protein
MGRPAHCTCWLMGATAINQYCFLCQPFGCSCHTGVHFCFLKLAVSAAIYIYPPMKKWKSCTICTTFRHKVRMLHSAAVPPGLFEALQGWQHHLCPRLPVKVQWFCYSLILRLMLVPICSNQNVVGLVLHFFFNLSFGKHMEKKNTTFLIWVSCKPESTASHLRMPWNFLNWTSCKNLGLLSLAGNSEKMVTYRAGKLWDSTSISMKIQATLTSHRKNRIKNKKDRKTPNRNIRTHDTRCHIDLS